MLLSEKTLAVLEQANLNGKTSANVPNDSPAIAEDVELLKAAAAAIGVDFEATKYTYRLVDSQNGRQIYGPQVCLKDDKAVLVWGETATPLASLKVSPDLDQEGFKTTLDFEFTCGTDENGEPALRLLQASVSLKFATAADGKKVYPDFKDLKKAFKAGKLSQFLAPAYVKPMSLKDLEPGLYQVVGYTPDDYEGQRRFVLTLDDGRKVKSNTSLVRRLESGPVITKELPATLGVEPSTKFKNGHPIIPVSLTVAVNPELPVFTF